MTARVKLSQPDDDGFPFLRTAATVKEQVLKEQILKLHIIAFWNFSGADS
jgi:hypothetical protein